MIFCLCGMVTLKPASGSASAIDEEVAQAGRRDQERQIDRVHAARLERAIVDRGRDRMADRVGDDAVDLGALAEFLDAVEVPQVARADLSGGGAFGAHRGGIGVGAAENGREDARRETQLAHRQDDHAFLGQRLGGRQHTHVVGRFAGSGDDLVSVRLGPS